MVLKSALKQTTLPHAEVIASPTEILLERRGCPCSWGHALPPQSRNHINNNNIAHTVAATAAALLAQTSSQPLKSTVSASPLDCSNVHVVGGSHDKSCWIPLCHPQNSRLGAIAIQHTISLKYVHHWQPRVFKRAF